MSEFHYTRRHALGLMTAATATTALSPRLASAQANLAFPIAPGAENPLGFEPSKIEGIFFNGGYGMDYINFAADLMRQLHPGTEMSVEGIQGVGDRLRPRFIAGNPPDVIDNSGAGAFDAASLRADGQLADLTALMEVPALDTPGASFAETLFPASQTNGVYEGRQVSLNAAYTVHGIWYNQALLRENGWRYPTTWDEMMGLCDTIRSSGTAPWAYGGRNAAHYLVRGIIYPLIYKLGGRSAVDDIMAAREGAWLKPEVLQAVSMVAELGTNGFFLEGSEALNHTEAQTEWLIGNAVFYPVGSWIENEMRAAIPDGFEMTMSPIPGPSAETFDSVLAGSSEMFFVPAQAQNVTGGLEYLRCLFSRNTAKFFAQNNGIIMPVSGVEAENISTAVQSAMAVVAEAGEDVFPLDLPFGTIWNGWKALSPELVQGRITPEDYVAQIEEISVAAAN